MKVMFFMIQRELSSLLPWNRIFQGQDLTQVSATLESDSTKSLPCLGHSFSVDISREKIIAWNSASLESLTTSYAANFAKMQPFSFRNTPLIRARPSFPLVDPSMFHFQVFDRGGCQCIETRGMRVFFHDDTQGLWLHNSGCNDTPIPTFSSKSQVSI